MVEAAEYLASLRHNTSSDSKANVLKGVLVIAIILAPSSVASALPQEYQQFLPTGWQYIHKDREVLSAYGT